MKTGSFNSVSWMMVHAHTEEGKTEHIYEEDIRREFGPHLHTDVLFYGHTHVPLRRQIDDTLVVNPGSVGQPRDGDSRAAYAVLDTDSLEVEIRRIKYDIDNTVQSIRDEGMPDRTAKRLYEGN